MPSSTDRKRLEVPTHLYDQLIEIAIDEDRTVASITQEVIAAGLQAYIPSINPARDFAHFTPRAHAALDRAHDEARAFNHAYLGTEHLLLGLLRVEDGVAARVLDTLGLDYAKCQDYCQQTLKRGDGTVTESTELPYVPRARKTLRQATREAERLGQRHVGTEHLLLALTVVQDGLAARILSYFGLLQTVTGETMRVIGIAIANR